MSEKPLVYLAGPYTAGDTGLHVIRAVKLAEGLYREGFMPYVPHLFHLWHLISPHPIEFWYQFDSEMLARCDAVVRLAGESKGADAEVELAIKLDLPVVEVEDVTESEVEEAAVLLRELLREDPDMVTAEELTEEDEQFPMGMMSVNARGVFEPAALLKAIQSVVKERAAQDAKWGPAQAHDFGTWKAIFGEEYGEADREFLRLTFTDRNRGRAFRHELVQATAVLVCMIECGDRQGWFKDRPDDSYQSTGDEPV